MKRWLPWILTAAFAAWIVAALAPQPQEEGFHVRDFGRLPMLLNGRVQPFDSVARNSLLTMRGKQTVAKEKGGTYIDACHWLLEVMLRPDQADEYKTFRVQHPEVQQLLGVQSSSIEYLSFNDIAPHIEEIEQQATPILRAEEEKTTTTEQRTPFQRDLLHLFESLIQYQRLKSSLQPEDSADFVSQHVADKTKVSETGAFAQELSLYGEAMRTGIVAVQQTEKGQAHNEKDLGLLMDFFKRYQNLEKRAYALIVPPLNPEQSRDDWKNIGVSLLESMKSGEVHPAMAYFANMADGYRAGRAAEFNEAVSGYRDWLAQRALIPELNKGRREAFFNHMEPFYKAMVIYVAALLLGCAYWLRLDQWIRRSAFFLLVLAFAIHTGGLMFRMFLEGRPPVTNLYSSAIFVGWGAVLLGIILEKIFRDGIGTVAAAAVGFSTQIIAHHLALGGDTMEMLRAVLDTNFWLATHVVMITTGYASMFFAGFLAILYILRGFFTRTLDALTAKSLSKMVYGIVCFATLFSFVGTILGGIWADQSWGRFWGWDPKENGALLIVIWCAVILHARWGGLVRERGLMVLAIFGNIVTSFSWFGVNMLGVGLHSYGFMDKAFKWLVGFVVSQVILMCLAMLPDRFWASFRGRAEASQPKRPAPQTGGILPGSAPASAQA
jgi:ABC-type transport system involved in cytochrome c biogenesis permease subunit